MSEICLELYYAHKTSTWDWMTLHKGLDNHQAESGWLRRSHSWSSTYSSWLWTITNQLMRDNDEIMDDIASSWVQIYDALQHSFSSWMSDLVMSAHRYNRKPKSNFAFDSTCRNGKERIHVHTRMWWAQGPFPCPTTSYTYHTCALLSHCRMYWKMCTFDSIPQ